MKRIRVFVIEDNRVLREGISAMINGQPDLKVVAASGGGGDIVARARIVKPEVVLLDLGLTDQEGIRLVASLRAEMPGISVVGMGLTPTQTDIVEFVEAGASGFIVKNAMVPEFLNTIRAVARGEKVLPPLLTESLFTHVVEHALKKGKDQLDSGVRMTKRELEIIALIAEGLSNKEIAQRLNIATYTVKSHVHNIMEKLTLHTRLQIAIYTRT